MHVGDIVDKGDEKVQAGIERPMKAPEALDQKGLLLRHDDKADIDRQALLGDPSSANVTRVCSARGGRHVPRRSWQQ